MHDYLYEHQQALDDNHLEKYASKLGLASNHIDAYRALDNPKFILLDEADFFRKGEQEDVRHVSERYIAKSDPYIVMVSTPNAPDGLFERRNLPVRKTTFRLYLWAWQDLHPRRNKAKASPSFEREYNLKYLGLIGKVFHTKDIEAAIQKGTGYSPDEINSFSQKSMGIDPAFGSSVFGIVIGTVTGNITLNFTYTLATNVHCVIVPLSGHWIPEEQPDFVVDQLFKFFGNSTTK
jgi:hypothetical protein